MFIEQAFKGEHDFWRYLLGSLMVVIASIIGQFPLLFAMVLGLASLSFMTRAE